MKKSSDQYCRNTIKKSITPSQSNDTTQNKEFEEGYDDFEFFNNKFEETLPELFESLEEVVYYINHELREKIENYCKMKRIDFSIY